MSADEFLSLYAKLTPEQQESADSNGFTYIFTKARLYLRIGPDQYRKRDYFLLPDADLTDEALDALKYGCEQILQGKGLVPDQPFEGIGIEGFSLLLGLFHYESFERNTYRVPVNGVTHFLDKISFRHLLDNSQVTYYNLVSPLS